MNKFEMAFTPNMEKSREKSDQELKNGGAIEIPDGVGGKRLELTVEQVENIRKEMQAEMTEEKKIEIVSKTVLGMYMEEIRNRVIVFSQSVNKQGGSADSVDIWESIRERLAWSVEQKMSKMISELKSKTKSETLLARTIRAIDDDVFNGPKKFPGKIPEAIDFNPEYMVASYIKDKESFSDDDLMELEAVSNLLQLNAQRKFFKWNRSGQLINVISLQEELIKRNDKFDWENAGFFELKEAIQNGSAALQLDLISKPNYKYARPEYSSRNEDYSNMLLGLSRIEARKFLGMHNLKI